MTSRLCLLALLNAVPVALAAPDALPNFALDFRRDPVLVKKAIGAFGVLGEVEPRVEKPEEVAMQERLGDLLAKDPATAQRELEKFITKETSAYFDLALAGLYQAASRPDDTLARLRAAVEKFPDFRRAWDALGRTYSERNQHDEAIRAFTKAIELGAKDGPLYGVLGYSFLAREQFVSAEAAFRSAMLFQPEVVNWKIGLARCFFKQAKYSESAALFGELIAQDQKRPEFWSSQTAAFVAMKEPLRAAQNLEIMRHLGLAKAENLTSLGDLYASEGLHDLGSQSYLRAFDLDPNLDPVKPLRAAEFLAARTAWEPARLLLARVKSAGGSRFGLPEKKRILRLEARIAMSSGAPGDYVKVMEQIVTEDPLDGAALIDLAKNAAQTGDTEKAVFWYERAESLKDWEPDACFRHGLLLAGKSRYEEALQKLKRSQELKPRDELKDYIAKVERMAKTR